MKLKTPQLAGPPRRSRPAASLSIGQKVGAIFLLVLVFAAANIVLVKGMLHEFNGVAATVNVAGKLRMLSQKIAFETVNMSSGQGPGTDGIEDSMQQFETFLDALQNGNMVFGQDIRRLSPAHAPSLDAVKYRWASYRDNVLNLLTASITPHVNDSEQFTERVALRYAVMDDATRLLGNTEALIGSIVEESQATQRHALLLMYTLFVVDMLMLFGAFALTRRQTVMPLRQLAAHCKELAAGNYNARVAFQSSDEIGQLALAFNDSAEHIGRLVNHIQQDRQSLQRAEAMFRGIAENSMVGVYIVKDGRFRFVNNKMAEIFHYEREEMLTTLDAFDIFAEDERATAKDAVRQRLAGDIGGGRHERRGRRKDGSSIVVEIFGSQMELDGERVVMGIAMDITQRKETEASARMASLVYETSSDAMVVTDANGVIIDVNPAFSSITGYAALDVLGGRLSILSSGRHDKSFYKAMWHALTTTGKWQGDVWNRRKNGEEYAERLTISTSYNDDGSVRCRIGLFSDITKKKQSDAFIWRQANYDHLTGLPNRQLFQDRLDRAIARSQRSGLPIALVFLDLDFFKDVNDTLGHGMGDELLKQVANRLGKCVRATDTVARLGGDEFTIIIGELHDTDVVERICHQTLKALAEPYQLGGEVASISTSMGVTLFPADAANAQELLKNADLAMYAAKDKGRNQFSYFTSAMQEHANSRRQLTRDLVGALDENQFVLHYQPIVDLRTGKICKAEALIRWEHPKLGQVSPAEFIPFAEDSGMIVGIGDWVFHEAARRTAQWRNSHANFQISVNVSPAQFVADGLDCRKWLAYLEKLHLPGDSIVIEITERLLMDAGPDVSGNLLAFRDAGLQVALDDFGTGYSSLSYLKKFHIDYIKIDQSFVRNLAPDTDDLVLCEAIVVMAHRLGLKVVAEGVETASQRDLLMAAQCDYAQGYFFSRPIPANQFQRLIDDWESPAAPAEAALNYS
ncbi:MAG TPA: EAL domain-containing protein [Candidimonas sp.]|nr:EAL domain-containing protein [Candidimonas sp.]